MYIEIIRDCDWSISVQLIPKSKMCNKSAKIETNVQNL